MRAEPKTRWRTSQKHTSKTRVTIGHTTSESLRHELSATRRAQVYRQDVEFAPADQPVSLPPRGSRERAELIAEVVRLRESGLSLLKISVTLEPQLSQPTVGNLLKEWKRSKREGEKTR